MAAANILRLIAEALSQGFKIDATDALSLLPEADDSTLNVGDGTNSFDVNVYGATSADYLNWDASQSSLIPTGDAQIECKVAADSDGGTLAVTDLCKIWTTRGASGAVTFTLPAAATAGAGKWVEFYNVADQNMIIAGQDEELVVFNDLTADSIAFQTTSEKIGGGVRCVCDGTSWICVPLATETQTVTIASA